MPACRTQRPRRSRSKWSNAARTSACGCRPDAGWPGKRGAHRALAARFRRSHHAPRSWPFARGGSARVSRPPGRRSSSSSQCGSTAATAPRRGRPQARRPTALDGASSALESAAWPPPAAAVRGAGSAPLLAHTRLPSACLAAAHRRGARRCAGGWCARGWRLRSALARGREALRVASVKLCRRHGRDEPVELRVAESQTQSLRVPSVANSTVVLHMARFN